MLSTFITRVTAIIIIMVVISYLVYICSIFNEIVNKLLNQFIA
jgi:hypothetical protein